MIVCPSCGRESADDAAFCARCGAALGVPEQAREERKVVSIVFVDLVGSTARAERLDPEDVRAILASYHARVRAELERFGGTVEKFIGDAVVAVFGAPVVHEDDAERAVRSALVIRDAMAEAGVGVRIAVNTGEALVSLDARPSEGEGMVAGDVVNTAARLQSAAPVGGVLVGEATYRATKHVIDYEAAEPVVAKGKSEPVPVWRAVAPKSRFGVDLEQTALVPLVGRAQEVDLLRDALARTRRERQPQLLTLVGVPGIGKSRLVTELFGVVEADPDLIFWRQGRCLPYGEGISYWALGEMAKAQAGILETDDAATAEHKLVSAVGSIVPEDDEAAWVTSHLRALVGLGGEGRASADSRGEAFAAWRRFLEGMAEQRPTVLVFEDLHWADDGLLDFVDGLVDRATGVPLLVVCSARPELLTRRPGWGGGKANAVTLSLSPLSTDDTARLIAELLEQAVLPAPMQQTLLARAEGNPLFAEEYIRMLRDRGLLRRDGDVWRLEEGEVDVPETVQGIIAARLDALSPDEKTLLHDAAVIGKIFWLGAVTSISEISRWDAEELLHALERKELIRRERRAAVAGEVEYAFRHVLVRDVAYGQIPRARRAELHLGAARWIESLTAERSEDRAEMLAHHYVSSLELLRAAGRETVEIETSARLALREAGHRAIALSAPAAAERSYRAALALWPADDPERPYLLLEIGRAVYQAANEAAPEVGEARDRLLSLGDGAAAAEAEFFLASGEWVAGNQEASFEHLDRAVALIGDAPLSASKVQILGYAFWNPVLAGVTTGDLEEGERVLALAQQLGDTTALLDTMISVGSARVYQGDVEVGLAHLRDAVELAERTNNDRISRAWVNLASLLIELGDVRAGAEGHRRGLAAARRFETRGPELWHFAETVVDDYLLGRWQESRENAERILADVAEHYMRPVVRQYRASIDVAQGERRGPMADVVAAVDEARRGADPQLLWPTLSIAAWVASECGQHEQARAWLAELESSLEGSTAFRTGYGLLDAPLVAAPGQASRLAAAISTRSNIRTPWLEAIEHIAAGELVQAADICVAAGDLVHATYLRLVAAERAGDETPALTDAISFFQSVGATAYLARAEALLQATA